jgi:hypothetical protein
MTSRRPPQTIEALIASPDHYLFGFEGDQAIFAAMDREAYRRSIFLDRRISPASQEMTTVPVGLLARSLAGNPPARGPNGWIFHIAHCGSTLLARALDRPRDSLVLREPLALRQLGVEAARSAGEERTASWRSRLRLAVSLAGRKYQAQAPVIVKANVPVNFIASDIMDLAPETPGILLHFPLRAYLLAILRSADHRQWVANVTSQVQPALVALIGEPGYSDIPERAAALWMAQMRLYAGAVERFAGLKSLNAERLFNTPAPVLAASAAHFGIPISEADIETIVEGPLFSTYSKSPDQAFDNRRRLEVQAETARLLGPEIDQARRWVDSRLARWPLPAELDRPLVGAGTPLLDG